MHNVAHALRDVERVILTIFYHTKSITTLVCVLYRRLHFIVSHNVCGAGLLFFLLSVYSRLKKNLVLMTEFGHVTHRID